VITALNGQPVRTVRDLRNVEGLLPVGTDITVAVRRDGRERNLRARLVATLSQLLGDNLDPRLGGAEFGPLPESAAARGITGALVTRLVASSAAARAGLRRGDVVMAVNGAEVASLEALRDAAGARPAEITLTILRNGLLYALPLR
jgi:serine protease DegQ